MNILYANDHQMNCSGGMSSRARRMRV